MKDLSPNKLWYVIRTNIQCEEKASRNLRLSGYEVYYPRQRTEVVHKRNHTILVKERPLMVGYLFVGQPEINADWYSLRACDGVECVLGVNGRPIPVPFDAVQSIFLAEIDMAFDETREARIRRKEEERTQRGNTRARFPKGKTVYVKDRESPFATFGGVVDEVTRSGRVKALIDIFNRMVPVEFDANQLTTAA